MAKTLFRTPKHHTPSEKLQKVPVITPVHKPRSAQDTPFGNPNDGDPHDHPGMQRTPQLTKPTGPAPFEPPPTLSKPNPPAPFEPPPTLSVPSDVQFQPPPKLSVPTDIPFQPAPPLSVPTEVPFQPAPALSTPSEVPFQPAPPLSTPAPEADFTPPPPLSKPADIPFQPAPALSVPKEVPFQQAPPLSKPRAVDDGNQPKILGIDISGYAEEWKSAIERQKNFFVHDVPRIAANMVNRALPRPGNIDPDLLPSTIATKALSAVANKVNNLENKYIYQPVSNAGASVARTLSNIAINSAPEGAYENSPDAPSLQMINNAGRENPEMTLSDLFDGNKKLILTAEPKLDYKVHQLGRDARNAQYRFDDSRGALINDIPIETAVRSSYFPFYFTDLRPTADGRYRTVFFKPVNLEVAESFAPEWNLQKFMGRVDPVATYQNTTRNLNIGFKMIAQHPSDLKVIYDKLGWLSSMTYPEYGSNMRYRSGPVVRMRIGDLINARSSFIPDTKNRPGVTGIITNLDYTYVPIWEVQDDWQLSREIDVSLSFVVLHELPVGVLNGEFGSIGLVDADGVFMTPQQALDDYRALANDESPSTEKDYVDAGGFRKYGK